jgi:hypothetical protein
MTHEGVTNLDMFIKLVGEKSLSNVVLLTTKWDRITDANAIEKAEIHENALRNKFWAQMMNLGSGPLKRHGKGDDSAKTLIAPILKFKPTWLQIQRELGKGDDLGQTSAGQYVERDLLKAVEELQAKHKSEMEQMRTLQEERIREAIAEQAEKDEALMKEKLRETRELNRPFSKVLQEEQERRSRVFGGDTLGVLYKYGEEFVATHPESEYRAKGLVYAALGAHKLLQGYWRASGVDKSDLPRYQHFEDEDS